MPDKRRIYFNEYNLLMDRTVYLPIVSGLFRAYAETQPRLTEHYEFMPFMFIRDKIDALLERYESPEMAVFSMLGWNKNISLTLARRIKERHPDCLIVFGGPQVPFQAEGFLTEHPFVDVAARGEGEQIFVDLLEANLTTREFETVRGITYRSPATGQLVRTPDMPLALEPDIYPSPYLAGVYDYLLEKRENDYHVIIETNRGCPFNCAYCFWGWGGLNTKLRYFSMERMQELADWCGRNEIEFVFNADSNFGIRKRDVEIAQYYVESKKKYGFPGKLRGSFSKNAEENVFTIGKMLTKNGMQKSISMSLQTLNPEAARNIGRKNIKLDIFSSLQHRYSSEGIPTFTELILGLPGETYDSFLDGLETVIRAGFNNQIFVYICQSYPNTTLGDPDYAKKHGIKTVKVALAPKYTMVEAGEEVPEEENLVVATNTMSEDEWTHLAVISWLMQILHGIRIGYNLLLYLHHCHDVSISRYLEHIAKIRTRDTSSDLLRQQVDMLYDLAHGLRQGRPAKVHLHEYSDFYWEPDEAAYLNIIKDTDKFYAELLSETKGFLDQLGIGYSAPELAEVVEYQKMLVPTYPAPSRLTHDFESNLPEFFDTFYRSENPTLEARPQRAQLVNVKSHEDKYTFAMEVLLFGRKSGSVLYDVQWQDLHD